MTDETLTGHQERMPDEAEIEAAADSAMKAVETPAVQPIPVVDARAETRATAELAVSLLANVLPDDVWSELWCLLHCDPLDTHRGLYTVTVERANALALFAFIGIHLGNMPEAREILVTLYGVAIGEIEPTAAL